MTHKKQKTPETADSTGTSESGSISGKPAPVIQHVDLGPGVEVIPFKPGRYANAIQRSSMAVHSQQVFREDGTSSFILNLEEDGTATVCRGWRYLSSIDGPEVHDMEHIREQLGYRGRWEHKEGWVLVDLALDDSLCPRISEYTHLVPNHATEWQLYFLPVFPREHALLPTKALLCQPIQREPVFGEDEPHVTAGILPGRWLMLGTGNGLKIRVIGKPVSEDEPLEVEVTLASEPISIDAWEHSF